MAQSHWEADKMLDVYIYDYLVKRNLQASAKAFLAEGKVSSDPVAIDAPGGFLFEWWSVFWDIFIARTNEKHSEVAASYIQTQQMKASEHQTLQQQLLHQQQQQQQQQQPPQQQLQHQQKQQLQLHLQQFQLLQRQGQPQQQQPRSSASCLGAAADTFITSPTGNASAIKIYEEGLKPPLPQAHQRDSLEEMKRFGDTVVPSQAALLKASPAPSSTPMIGGPMAHGPQASSVLLQQPQMRPQLPASSQDNKSDVSAALHRSPGPDPSLFNVPAGSADHVKSNLLNPGNNSMTSKSWSLSGMDQLRPGLLTNQKPGLQPYTVLSSQHQQQLQAQGSLQTSGLSDMDPRKMRLLFNRSLKDGQATSLNDTSNAASLLPRNPQDPAELLLKMKMAQMQPQQAPQAVQPPSSQTTQQQQQQQVTTSADIPPSHSRPGDQVYGTVDPTPSTANGTGTGKASLTKCSSLNGRKRKQPSNSSGPANSGPSPNSPSSPSTHTPGAVAAPTTSKSLVMYGSEEAAAAGLVSPPSTHQLADLERFAEDNVDSFLSPDTDADHREPNVFGRSKASPAGQTKSFQFNEVTTLRASTSKVVCCHFSSDGKLLASAGHDKKVMLWDMDNYKLKCTLDEHSFLITDIRFSLNSSRLATSSFDRTVRVWDADNPAYSFRTFTGHQISVMSLDFHPVSEDLLCSCDGDNEIRYWSVSQGVCSRAFKGGMAQTRFQPRVGRLLAAAAENVVSIFDVETEMCVHSLQRHTKPVHSVCWDATGDYVASVSEDSVRVWSLEDGECVHELSCNGNKFHSCTFHPTYSRILVIGCYQSLELWDMTANKSMTVPAHDGLIAALAQSPQTGMVASASHDKCVKLWRS